MADIEKTYQLQNLDVDTIDVGEYNRISDRHGIAHSFRS